jgi:predicted RNA-binding Zn ribbon-like protein
VLVHRAVSYLFTSTSGKTASITVTPETIKLWGGTLCLDFANSVDWTDRDEPVSAATDALHDPGALGRWGRRMGIVRGRPPATDGAELEAALALRLVLHRLFSALAEGRRPRRDDLATLAGVHAEAAGAARLATAEDGAWRLRWPASDPRAVRFAVAVDAVALLADPARLARVHRCPGPSCGWLFLDTSGRRRWCSMSTCGSRVKMRRLYERRRQADRHG